MYKKVGKATVALENPVSILSGGSVAGKKEAEGPFGAYFDVVADDEYYGEKSFEKAESRMQREAFLTALQKSGVAQNDIEYILAGDLLNQCIGSHYSIRETNIPFFGLYGACSTMAESISLGSMLIDGGYAKNVAAVTSSHFCSAERQFRYPLEYGGQRPPTAQWTATGSGSVILSSTGEGPYITHVTTGKIVDMGIKDANNMGAAMAPAAFDTIDTHFTDTGYKYDDYDLILTGDLGMLGSSIVRDMFFAKGIDLGTCYNDCGNLLFTEKQDVHAGASGCGCSALVLTSYILNEIKKGTLKKVLFVGTGALMSTTALYQGESIPSIAHAVTISKSIN